MVEDNKKESQQRTNEEEISIDFSKVKEKIKRFFGKKKAKEERKEERKNEEDISFDLQKMSSFFKHHQKWLIPVLFIFIAIVVSTYFRTMPAALPITEDWAQKTIYNFYQNQIEAQINQQYPNLPQQNRNALIQKDLQTVLEQNKEQIERDVAQLSQQYKNNFQDENGDAYIIDIDSYLWYSQARNVINHGHLGDKIIDGQSYFSLRNGRLGKVSSLQLHPYFAAYWYKVFHLFDSSVSLMKAFLFLPAVIIGLALIPAFFIGRRLAGNVSGFFAAMLLAVNGPVLTRSSADTDPQNILFPLIIVWLFVEAFTAKKQTARWLLSSAAGLFVGLYAITWSGWSHIFLVVLIAISMCLAFEIGKRFIQNKYKFQSKILTTTSCKSYFLLLIGFIVSSGIFVSIFQNTALFLNVFSRITRFTTLKAVGVKSIWPNVLTTVAEFNTTSFSNIISQHGGKLFFLIAMMGIIILLVNRKKMDAWNIGYVVSSGLYYIIMLSLSEKLNNPLTFIIFAGLPVLAGLCKVIYLQEEETIFIYPFLLAIWIFTTAYAFSKGIRFSILMGAPFSIAAGVTLGIAYQRLSSWIDKGLHINKHVSRVLVFAALALLLIAPFSTAKNIAKNEIPGMNDGWFEALTKIKEDSTRALITSWWDFGHWFVAIAERMVTFDGGDQGERIHWVGKTLLTNNEAEAVGILRMLNCAQETAPHKLDEFTGDSLRSITILYDIFSIADKNKAYQKYQELGLTKEQAKTMLEYTHCADLIPNYYITSEDMVGKAGVWGHFGSWDFTKATMYQNTHNLARADAVAYLTTTFNLSEEEADRMYSEIQTTKGDQWIAPWPGYLSSGDCDTLSYTEIRCAGSAQGGNFAFRIDLNTFNVTLENNPGIVPTSIVYPTEEGIQETELTGKKTGFSVVLLPDGEKHHFLLTDPSQAASTFTKLFFYEGHGMKCFSKFDDRRQITGDRIVTWKVDYSCSQVNDVYFTEPVEEKNISEDENNGITTTNETNHTSTEA